MNFLVAFPVSASCASSSAGVMMDIDGSDLQLLTPSACKAFYDLEVPNDLPEEGGILGLRIALDMARAKAVLGRGSNSLFYP